MIVVSPGDVAAERNAVELVVDDPQPRCRARERLPLPLWRWETDARPGLHLEGPPGLIDERMEIADSDVVVGIFWKRFGTPTGDAQSGTEHELRKVSETRLDELLGEANKLRHALAALVSRDGGAPPPARGAPSASPERARRAPAPRTATSKPARSRASSSTAATAASAEPVEPPASASAGSPARTGARAASGSTKSAVLQALAGGSAMTAGEVATATGLSRASVSTTLSKLASSGEVTKAARGYQLAGPTAAEVPADMGASTEDGELGE